MPGSPLQLVACQLRFADAKEPISAGLSAKIVAALGARGYKYTRVEAVQVANLQLNFSPAGIQTANSSPATAYRLSDDGKWNLTLAPDTISLETSRYGRWKDDFRERFLAALEIIEQYVNPAVTTRVGLRYVDVVRNSSNEPAAWKDIIKDDFLGPLLDGPFAKSVRVSQQQINLSFDSEIGATLRHGLFFDQSEQNEMRYLIDTDVFRENFAVYDREAIYKLLDEMHAASLSLFQYVITTQYYESLKS